MGNKIMTATIRNDVLITSLEKHLKGKVRESVNFTFTPDLIKLQSSSDFVYETYIQGDYPNDMVGESFSIMIDNSIKLLKVNKEFATMTRAGGELVVIDQENISIPFNTTYDERIEISYSSFERQGNIRIQDFTSIVRGFRNLVNLSKTLEVGVPPVLISTGKVYCMYSNTIFIGKVPMEFPNLEIPYNTFNSLSKNLSGNSTILSLDQAKKIILVQTGLESSATTIYKNPNMELITSIEQKLSELEYIGNYDVSIISTLELLFKCFPREVVTISMYEDGTVGITFSLINGKNIKAGTKDIMTKANINISTTQFDALYKTFKGISKLEVYKGRDIVCLKIPTKTLVLSGMTF